MALFEGLSGKLQGVLDKMKGMSRVTEKDVKEMMREVKLSLLEADVNFKVVKSFISNVSQKAIGEDVLNSLTPGQQVVKVVNDELVILLGGEGSKLTVSPKGRSVYMMVGLQGSGKTTASGKLANLLRKSNGKKPLLVACDVYRPAAVDQLQTVGKQLNIPVYSVENCNDPVRIASEALKHAEYMMYDTVIVDTAGRLHIDEKMMEELVSLKQIVKPQEILLVVDAMTGQDAVNVAEAFNDTLGVDGIILTKLDGDTRGGAALSVKSITGKPIKFVGTGEKLNDIEVFFPDRMASRILGMGDVLSLIEKAQELYNEDESKELAMKMTKNRFTLEDFLNQMQQMKKLGSISKLVGMIPGIKADMLKGEDLEKGEANMKRMEAIIRSMTLKERLDPGILDANRRIRIAKGSGTKVQDVNLLIKQFDEMKKMMKQFTNTQKSSSNVSGKLKKRKFR